MTLLGLPLAQLLVLLVAGTAALTLLYLLKQRRRRVEVPFVRLWQRVLSESESTSLWQRIKRVLSLLIQILILALIVSALGDPRLAPSQKGRTLALVIDASASMQARVGDGRQTRMDLAREEARAIISGLAGDDQAVVVSLDGQPAPMGGLSQEERELYAQIEAVSVKDEPQDLARALRLSSDLLRDRPNPQVVLISDGGFEEAELARLQVPAWLDVRYQAIGAAEPAPENVAITAFSVRRYRQNRLSYEVLVELMHFGAERGRKVEVALELLQEGEIIDVQELALTSGERLQRLYPNLSGSGLHLMARVRRKDGGPDVLPLDDRAFALLPERQRQRLLLVTPGNLFLEGALLSIGASEESRLEVSKIPPERYSAKEAARHDVVVLDGFTPPVPPDAHALYLDPRAGGSPIAIAGTVKAPLFTEVAREHPLLRFVNLKDLNVSTASVFRLRPGDVALGAMLRQPLIVAREEALPAGVRRTIALGFDVRKSDLPLRVAFPVLLMNALDWFAGEAAFETSGYPTGRTWRIPLPAARRPGQAEEDARLLLPGGAQISVPVHEGHALYHGDRVGFYELFVPGARPLLLSANLSNDAESAARVHKTITIGGRALLPPEGRRSAPRRVLWPYLVLTALLILCVEWWTYHRRWTV